MHATVSRSARRGGALILALLFIGVISAGFASWALLIQQRAGVSDLEEHQARKRLAAANSEMMVRDYMLTRVLAANGDDTLDGGAPGSNGAAWSTSTTAIWKGSTLIDDTYWPSTTGWRGYALDSISWIGGINGFSPTYDYPYSKTLTFNANYKQLSFAGSAQQFPDDATTYRAYLRSSSPILGGDLLVLHQPNPAVTGNVAVQGRVVHFAPNLAASAYTARSQRFTSPGQVPLTVVPASIAGGALLVSNLPWTALSSGNINNPNIGIDPNPSVSTDWRLPDFSGLLNVIDASTTNASNSLKSELELNSSTIAATGITDKSNSRGLDIIGATGIATISPCLGSATPDLPGVSITNGLSELVIEGQSGPNLTSYAPFRPAFAVVYTQDATPTGRNLTTIRLRNQNRRPMILALKKATRSPAINHTVNVIVESPVTGPTWRLIIIAENVPLNITYATSASPLYQAATVNLVGGIQTDSPLNFPASPQLFEIQLETDTRGLLRLSPRLAWTETFLTGKL